LLIDPRHRRIALGVECNRGIIDVIVIRFVLPPRPALPTARRDLDACSPLDRNLRFGGLMDRFDGIVIGLRLGDRADRSEREYDRRRELLLTATSKLKAKSSPQARLHKVAAATATPIFRSTSDYRTAAL
jgi:hypothetical protein